MPLVHKTVDVRLEVWKKLRLNAELSGVHLRDYLTFLIENSSPIASEDAVSLKSLLTVTEANREERSRRSAIPPEHEVFVSERNREH